VVLPSIFAFLVGFSWIQELFPWGGGENLDRYFWLGLGAILIFMAAMVAFAYYLRKPISRLLLLSAYAVILITQLVMIFYTQSRGPLLGLLGGLFAYFALLGVTKKRVWLPWLMTGAAAVVILFLIAFNTVDTPLMEQLREMPYVGRLGKVLQTEEGTGRVRVLIWQGVVNMIDWHPPLQAPVDDWVDPFNAIRPFIGYGPESMYVAYNRFYPPDLAHFEARNASPDRSHNETFDSLAITGGIGFVVYMFLFCSVFYYGLKWLGLIQQRWQKLTFVGLWLAGGTLGAVGAWAWRGPVYVGVGIPGGVMFGLGLYVFIEVVLATFHRKGQPTGSGRYGLWVLALFAAIVAHFVEIHFGIAIAATRTYFWIYTAMLVVVGTRLALQPSEAEEVAVEVVAAEGERQATPRRRRRRSPAQAPQRQPRASRESDWQGSLLVWCMLAILVLSTILFNSVTIQADNPGALATVVQSLTQARGEPSLVMLVLFVSAWFMFGLVSLCDLATQRESEGKGPSDWLLASSIFVLVTLVGWVVFALLHASRLKPVTINSVDAPNPLANTITFYYVWAFLVVVALAAVLTFLFRRVTRPWHWGAELEDIAAVAVAILLPLIVAVMIFATNISIVRADIVYKQGLSAEKAKQWDGAIYFYEKAIEMAREQDFYYLFLGRAYMEKAKTVSGDAREQLFQLSEQALNQARELAPLNTDHSANLARLYRTWGGLSQGDAQTERLNRALDYYADATSLSPHNAQLFDEWGQTYLALGETDKALEMYDRSLALDQEYAQTYLLIGEFYMRQKDWEDARNAYEQASEVSPNTVDAYSALGYVSTQMGDLEAALQAYLKAVELQPKNYTHRKNLAILYQQLGQIDDAIREATTALDLAPESEKQSMQNFLAQLQQGKSQVQLTPEQEAEIQQLISQGSQQMSAEEWDAAEATFQQILALDPNHPQAHSGLAYVYAKQGRVDEAIAENLIVTQLAPNDYNSYKNLALLYQDKGDLDKAIAAAEQAVALAPDNQKDALQTFVDQLKQAQGEAPPAAEPAVRAGDLTPEERNDMYKTAPSMIIDPSKTYRATIVTKKGNIVVDLDAAKAPQTVNNFVYLAQQGFYDSLTFHRVESSAGFALIQGGDPLGTGRGGPGYTIPAEIGLPHDEGAIAMARLGDQVNPEKASSGSQFYICLVPIHQLDGGYTVFGYVVEGLDVAKQIAVGDQILTIVISEQ
jgi:cyclophilin family peptidyl-prolyl cis-trans isomerase/tetratricopeptide (TPR) repeat protein/O-antigen ligase